MSCDCDTGIIQASSDDMTIYDKNTLPNNAEIIMLTEEQNFDYGGLLSVAYRLPLSRIIPTSSSSNLWYYITDEEADIPVPDTTVVPAYTEPFDPYGIKRAQASSPSTTAHYLIVGLNPNIDDNYIIQADGFYTFPEPHSYNIGQQYYLSDSSAGGVTDTPPPGIQQKLFIPIDRRTIRINLES